MTGYHLKKLEINIVCLNEFLMCLTSLNER